MIFNVKNNQFTILGNTLDNLRNKLINFDEVWMQGARFGSKSNQIIPEDKLTKVLSLDEAEKQLSSLNKLVGSGKMTYEQYFNTIGKGNTVLENYVTTTDKQNQSAQGLVQASKDVRAAQIAQNEAIKQSTLSYKAATLAKKAFAIAGNMLLMWGISKVISKVVTGLHKLSQASKEIAKSAKEIGETFSSTKSDIKSYQTQVEDLYKTINDSSSSINEVTQARQQLFDIQKEMIEKYGVEEENIRNITDAINGQTDAWEKLSEAKWQETKNKFNDNSDDRSKDVANRRDGYSDNIDRMLNEYGNYSVKISFGEINGKAKRAQAKALLEEFGEYSTGDNINEGIGLIKLDGDATQVYEKLR